MLLPVYDEIIDVLPDPILIVNGKGIILSCNPVMEKLFHYPKSFIIQKPLQDMVIAGTVHALNDYLRICSRSKRVTLGSIRLQNGYSDTIQTIAYGSLLRPRSKTEEAVLLLRILLKEPGTYHPLASLTERVEALSQEILKRKEIEEELCAERERLQVTLKSIGDAVIATDAKGLISFLNPVAEKLTGWVLKEACGIAVAQVFKILVGQTRLRVEDLVEKAVKAKTEQSLASPAILLAKNGYEYAIEASVAPIINQGKLFGIIVVFRECEEKRRLEKELQQRAKLLLEQDRRKEEYLAMLAHELRNPLAPISNALSLLESSKLSAAKREAAVDLMKRQITQMTHLLDDLLDASRITHGKIELRQQECKLDEIIQDAVQAVSSLIKQKSQSVAIQKPEKPLWLYADRTRITQAFINLLNNAAKYTGKGGNIFIEASENKGLVWINFKDTGIGIAAEMIPYIFDAFEQVDQSLGRSQCGLGIGLTLVKSIVELHHGSVEAVSEGEGKGSEFLVKLPLLTKNEMIHNMQIPTLEEENVPLNYKILVVDDNDASAKTLGWTLEALGSEVQLAHDGITAMEIARTYCPHIIFLDIGLPGLSGYDICSTLKKESMFANTLFIAQTGWSQKEHLNRSQEAGFHYHLVKPINMEELEKILEDNQWRLEQSK